MVAVCRPAKVAAGPDVGLASADKVTARPWPRSQKAVAAARPSQSHVGKAPPELQTAPNAGAGKRPAGPPTPSLLGTDGARSRWSGARAPQQSWLPPPLEAQQLAGAKNGALTVVVQVWPVVFPVNVTVNGFEL